VKDRKTGVERIWKRIQRMGEPTTESTSQPAADAAGKPEAAHPVATQPETAAVPVEIPAPPQQVVAASDFAEPPGSRRRRLAARRQRPRPRKPPKGGGDRAARGARPPRWLRCCSERTAPPSPKS
jgi:hypothetical protein